MAHSSVRFPTAGMHSIPASVPSCTASTTNQSFFEGGHQLEKLEFALAVAMTRGDRIRCETLRGQIAELGGNIEEPGT